LIYKQAVVGSRDEERERLRQELKAAQDELNMLREIQRKVSITATNYSLFIYQVMLTFIFSKQQILFGRKILFSYISIYNETIK
jgi:hypothetical protein